MSTILNHQLVLYNVAMFIGQFYDLFNYTSVLFFILCDTSSSLLRKQTLGKVLYPSPFSTIVLTVY